MNKKHRLYIVIFFSSNLNCLNISETNQWMMFIKNSANVNQ